MAHIEFAASLRRHVACEALTREAATLGALLAVAFERTPGLRDYVVDEQGRVRKHVAVFVNGELLHDRGNLSRPLAAGDRVYVAQALSGG